MIEVHKELASLRESVRSENLLLEERLKQHLEHTVAERFQVLNSHVSNMEVIVSEKVDAFTRHISDMESEWCHLKTAVHTGTQEMEKLLNIEMQERVADDSKLAGAVKQLEDTYHTCHQSIQALQTDPQLSRVVVQPVIIKARQPEATTVSAPSASFHGGIHRDTSTPKLAKVLSCSPELNHPSSCNQSNSDD